MPNRRHSGQRVSRHECEQPFAQLPLSLLGGVVLNALSIMARRVLDRLIAEHLKHGGRDNGRLHVSYRQLAQWTRANDGNIPPALAELVDLGLLVITHGERVAGSSKVAPNVYRLTFFPDHEDAASTDEWRRWEPSRGAPPAAWDAAASRAREAVKAARKRRTTGMVPSVPRRRQTRRRRLPESSFNASARVSPADRVIYNKQTRAAINEANVAHNILGHPTQDGVEPPHAKWGGKGCFHSTQDGVEPDQSHPTQDGVSSISPMCSGGTAAQRQRVSARARRPPLRRASDHEAQ
jgi:hypothetical protein